MGSFPVSHSNLSARHLGVYLQNKYAFDGPVTCRIVRSGINDSYIVEDRQKKYLFRIYSLNWRTENEILEETRLLNWLSENGIPVSYPIPSLNKDYILSFDAPEGERFGVMFSYAEGEKLQNYSGQLHYEVGKLMAQLHSITENLSVDRVTYDENILLRKSFEQVSIFLPEDTEEWKFMKSVQQQLLEECSRFNTDELRSGVVHLDIWADNFNVDKNQVITIFDFDFCGNGWLCLDIAYYIIQLYNMERYDVIVAGEKLNHFLKGYESITKLTHEEKRILPELGTALNFFYLGIQCQRFENWSNGFLNETYLKRFIGGVLKKYYEIERPSMDSNNV